MLSIWTCQRFCPLVEGTLFTRQLNLSLAYIENVFRLNFVLAQMFQFLFDRVGNIVGKGENASNEDIVEKGEKCGLPAFSPFPTMSSKVFFS